MPVVSRLRKANQIVLSNVKLLIVNKTYILIIISFLTIASAAGQTNFYQRLADSAQVLTQQTVTYYPTYRVLAYPNGDVPADKGVCTDVIIRAYRKLGIDLQK